MGLTRINDSDAVYEKGQGRLPFEETSFSVCSEMLHVFCKSVAESNPLCSHLLVLIVQGEMLHEMENMTDKPNKGSFRSPTTLTAAGDPS